jgi:hypothetical protein
MYFLLKIYVDIEDGSTLLGFHNVIRERGRIIEQISLYVEKSNMPWVQELGEKETEGNRERKYGSRKVTWQEKKQKSKTRKLNLVHNALF